MCSHDRSCPGALPPGSPGTLQIRPGTLQISPGAFQVPPGTFQIPPGTFQIPPLGLPAFLEIPMRDDELIFRGGTILTIDAQHRVLAGDVACQGGAIVQVGGDYTPKTGDY